jgi:hypothetical protein
VILSPTRPRIGKVETGMPLIPPRSGSVERWQEQAEPPRYSRSD